MTFLQLQLICVVVIIAVLYSAREGDAAIFCKQCGQELPPRVSFCVHCGAQVKKTATPVTGPRVKRIYIIVGAVSLAAIVAIVMLLVLVVFKGGGGPEGAVRQFCDALEKKDGTALMKTIDKEYFQGDQKAEKEFRDCLIKGFPEGGHFSGLKCESKVEGNEATVKVVGGCIICREGGKEKKVDIARARLSDEFELTRDNGKWLIWPGGFVALQARELMETGDKSAESAMKQLKDTEKVLTSALEDLEAGSSPGGDEFDPEKILADVTRIVEKGAKASEQYDAINELEGAGDYAEYAKLKNEATQKAMESSVEMLSLLQFLVKAALGEQVDMAEGKNLVRNVSDLCEEAEKLIEEADKLKKEKNL